MGAKSIFSFLFFFTIFSLLQSSVAWTKPKHSGPTKKGSQLSDTVHSQKPSGPTQPSQEIIEASKSWEVRTAPLALIARWYTLEALYRLNDEWALGPSYIKFGSTASADMFFPSYRGKALGFVGTHYFPSSSGQGLYGTVRYYFQDYTAYEHDNTSSEFHLKGHSLAFVGGYRLPFLKSFFFMPGIGIQLGKYEKTETKTDIITHAVTVTTDSNYLSVIPYLEAKVGVEF